MKVLLTVVVTAEVPDDTDIDKMIADTHDLRVMVPMTAADAPYTGFKSVGKVTTFETIEVEKAETVEAIDPLEDE